MPVFPWGMKQRRMTSDEWTAEDPVLEDGEIGFETDTGLSKTGRGNIVWSNLDYDQDWENITNRPDTFPPDPHDHDDIYKREADIDADHYTKDDWNQAMIGSPWDSGRTYANGDTVAHQGVYWVSQQDNNTAEPGTDTNYWQQYRSPSGDLTTLVEAPPGDNITYEVSDGGAHRFVGGPVKDSNGYDIGLRLHNRSLSNSNYSFDSSEIDVRWTGDYSNLPVQQFGPSMGSWDDDYIVFTFSEDGVYRVDAILNINAGQDSSRSVPAFKFLIDTGSGWEDFISWTHSYARDVYGKAVAIPQFMIREFNAGDKFKSQVVRKYGSANLTTATNGSHIAIQKLG